MFPASFPRLTVSNLSVNFTSYTRAQKHKSEKLGLGGELYPSLKKKKRQKYVKSEFDQI